MARLKVFFLTHRVPYAPNRGDRVRAYHMLHALAEHADVTLVSLAHDEDEAAAVDRIRDVVSRVAVVPVPRLANRLRALVALGSQDPLTTILLDSPALLPTVRQLVDTSAPDVVLAYCSSMSRPALDHPLRRYPLVLDMVDADSEKWKELSASHTGPMKWIYRREARTLSCLEARAMRAAYATVAVNAREVTLLKRTAPDARIEVVGLGVDLAGLAPPGPPAAAPRVVFTGVMNYEPNVAGAIWLAREVWPIVRRAIPAAELRIVGASPTRSVRNLHRMVGGIVVTGTVDDVRPELWNAAIAVAPLHVARGVQNKVLEALAARLPCVVTPNVLAGLPTEVLSACEPAPDAIGFANAMIRLLNRSPAERRTLADIDLSSLSWSAQLAPLIELLRSAAS